MVGLEVALPSLPLDEWQWLSFPIGSSRERVGGAIEKPGRESATNTMRDHFHSWHDSDQRSSYHQERSFVR
jgi:hypothetical protein